jgi:hypothetical protein
MNETIIMELPCELVVREGISKKSGKPYRMTILRVLTNFGVQDVVLDTRTDRAGIVLDMLARKEV